MTFNRIQIFKIVERVDLSSAAEILFDARTRLGKFDLDFSSQKTQTPRDGKYHSLFESFDVGGGTHCKGKYNSIRRDVHGSFVFPEAKKKYGGSR